MPYGMGPLGWRHYPYGFGGGWWNPWGYGPPVPPWGPPTKEEEIRFLEEEANFLREELSRIEKRLEELKKMIREQIEKTFPMEFLAKFFNLFSFTLLIGIFIFGGAQISSIGIKLLRK